MCLYIENEICGPVEGGQDMLKQCWVQLACQHNDWFDKAPMGACAADTWAP